MIMRETGDEMGVIPIGTESQIKQQGQMMSEMRDEMGVISIGTESQIKQQGQMEREMRDEMGVISIGTESQIKQQGQMMSEMRDEMRDISITSKLSLEMISKVFMQVHIFNHLSLWVLRWKLLKHKLPSSTHSRATTNWKLFYQCGVSG